MALTQFIKQVIQRFGLAISEKYGSSPRAWLIVSVVGAFLIDLINAVVITWFGTL
jgi:ESS family glutamate:Na+ symporter